jgi:cytochrome c oxidase subunit IV
VADEKSQKHHHPPGPPGHGGAAAHAEGAHGIGTYAVIWAILLVFTALTVWTGKTDLGRANIFIAMFIAITKATLVVLFFMHLKDSGGVIRLVFVVSVLFVVVLLLGVFGDLFTRLPMTLPPNAGPVHGAPAPMPVPGALPPAAPH